MPNKEAKLLAEAVLMVLIRQHLILLYTPSFLERRKMKLISWTHSIMTPFSVYRETKIESGDCIGGAA